jgi:hypothetical protein
MTSARAMALGAAPLAWFCAATWPTFSPPLTCCAQKVETAGGIANPDTDRPIQEATTPLGPAHAREAKPFVVDRMIEG